MEATQMNLFEASYEKAYLPKHVRLIELFAGLGAQSKALEILGADFEIWRTCEWSWQSIMAYNAIHKGGEIKDTSYLTYEEVLERIEGVSNDYESPMSKKQLTKKGEEWARKVYGAMLSNNNFCPNVSKLHASDLQIEDKEHNTYVMFYSFPCFTGDEMVLTKDNGYVPFVNLKIGQLVLGKDGKWHKILKFFDNGIRDTSFVEAMGFASIHCTPDHKFWTRKMKRTGHKNIRTFSEPNWVHAKDLSKDCYLGVPVVSEETEFYSNDNLFWELIGIYVGDGWVNKKAIFICGNEAKSNRLVNLLKKMGISYSVYQDSKHCWRFRIVDESLLSFVERNIGTGCKNKRIPYNIIALPKTQLECFLNGYISADGCKIKEKFQITTTNKNMAYSFSLIINKLYKRACAIYEVKVKDKKTIEGRVVNQSNWYQLRFKKKDSKYDKAFYENGFIWYPFKKYTKAEKEHVYDIEVDEAHSFTLNGCIVSNCQDLSVAGQQKGMERGSGTRSGLLWEVERILLECKESDCLPQVLVMENVPLILSGQNIGPFNDLIDSLHEIGYTSYYKIMNAVDYGIPQSRERCFMVSILGENSYSFPKPMELQYNLHDFIDKEVDESYFLPDEWTENFEEYEE